MQLHSSQTIMFKKLRMEPWNLGTLKEIKFQKFLSSDKTSEICLQTLGNIIGIFSPCITLNADLVKVTIATCITLSHILKMTE